MAVEIQKEGNLAIITLNRPEARNAINGEMAMTMEACLDEFENDENLWVGILKAEGTVFCAGADLKEINAESARWECVVACLLHEDMYFLPISEFVKRSEWSKYDSPVVISISLSSDDDVDGIASISWIVSIGSIEWLCFGECEEEASSSKYGFNGLPRSFGGEK